MTATTDNRIPAAGYVRCSTKKEEQAQSIPSQKAKIEEYAEANGYRIVEWYEDRGFSGTRSQGRPAFLRLLEDVKAADKPFKAVLVYDTDRFGRFINPDEGTALRFECEKFGAPVRFVVDAGVVNQSNFGSRIFLTVKQEVATEESRKKSGLIFERSRVNAERGCSSGGRPPFGYQRYAIETNGTRRLLLDGKYKAEGERVEFQPGPDAAVELVRRIFAMRGIDKMGFGSIAESLNREGVPSPSGRSWGKVYVKHLLENPIYVGTLTYGKTMKGKFRSERVVSVERDKWATFTNEKLAIISREAWDRVRAMDETRKHVFRVSGAGRAMTSQRYLLSGLMVCTECGRAYQGQRRRNAQGKDYFYYTDGGTRNSGPSLCKSFHIQRDFLESEVLALVGRTISRGLNADRLIGKLTDRLAKRDNHREKRIGEVGKALLDTERQLGNLVKAVADGADFAMMHESIQSLQSRKRELEAEKRALVAAWGEGEDHRAEAETLVGHLREFAGVLASGTPTQRKAIIRRMVPRIEISKAGLTAKVYVRPLAMLSAGKSVEDLDVVGCLVNAGGRNRTDTGFRSHRILSPARLPIPPLRHEEGPA